MKKMYVNNSDEAAESITYPNVTDDKKKIKYLEDTVRKLSEQVNRLASALQVSNRQIRRQGTDIHNVTTVLRSHK